MSELDAIRAGGDEPVTFERLVSDLRALGLPTGAVAIVHSSLSSMGWVCGGAQTAVEALLAVLGPDGTLVTPAFTGGNSEPAYWCNPPVPESWWDSIRASAPAYQPGRTPTRCMGALVECLRGWPGVQRSDHPQHSFCALGPEAGRITSGHGLEFGLGESSPLARLYDFDAQVLLLGVGHENNSSLHLAEYRARWAGRREIEQGAAMLRDGLRTWVVYRELDLDAGDFARIGADYAGPQVRGTVARAPAVLTPQRTLVDFAVGWIERNRAAPVR